MLKEFAIRHARQCRRHCRRPGHWRHFGTIVASSVGDVLMPLVGLLLGGVDFSNFFIVLKQGTPPGPYASVTRRQGRGGVALGYGLLINTIVNFAIVAFALFIVVKGMNATRREQAVAPAAPPEPSKEERLLTEIRDLLARR